MSLVLGAIAVVGGVIKGVSGGRARNDEIIAANERYGSNIADIEYRTANHVSSGQEAARAASIQAGNASLQIEMRQQTSAADARTTAAHVGAEGGSVEMGLADLAMNADVAKGDTILSLEAQQQSIRTRTQDAIVGETSRLGDSPTSKMGYDKLQGALGGLFAYGSMNL